MSGNSQVVRLPKDFQFGVKEVDFQTLRRSSPAQEAQEYVNIV